MPRDWPPLLNFLSETLNYRVVQSASALGFDLFSVDLSSWRLRFSNRTRVVWVKEADACVSTTDHLVQSLQDVIRQQRWSPEPLLVLVDGDTQSLVQRTREPSNRLVFIGAGDQRKVIESRRPTADLQSLVLAQVAISTLAPYETAAPVTGSRFFGRSYEVNRILSKHDTNHIILGIRRIGKTSILKEIHRRLAENEGDPDPPYLLYLDCSDFTSTQDFITEVVRRLNAKELPRLELQNYSFFFPNFLERMARMYHRKIVFFLDEIDNLIVIQRGHWDLIPTLRASSNKEVCQYIMAGFREAMLEQNSLDSPFFNFAEPIYLNEFTRQQAKELIVTPMESLQIRFRNRDDVLGRIYEETAGHPNLIQYYCSVLLKHLDLSGEREITPSNLIDVYTDQGFKSHLLTSFMHNTANREKAVVYAVLSEIKDNRLGGITQAFMTAALRKRGILMLQTDLEDACEVLRLAGVLVPKGREYHFTSPVFIKVLQQTHDVDYLLKQAKEEGLWAK